LNEERKFKEVWKGVIGEALQGGDTQVETGLLRRKEPLDGTGVPATTEGRKQK